jgi:hypothetical protein
MPRLRITRRLWLQVREAGREERIEGGVVDRVAFLGEELGGILKNLHRF